MRAVRYITLGVVVVAVGVVITLLIHKTPHLLPRPSAAARAKDAAAQVPTARVTRGTLSVTLAANGVLESAVETPVRSEITGNLIELCENNTPVAPGDVVFRLDTRELQDQYDELARGLADAEEGISTVQADSEVRISQANTDFLSAQENFELAQAKARAELEKIKAQINHAEGELARSEGELARSKRLAALNYIPGTKLREAEEAYRKTQFNLEQQRKQLADAEKRTDEQLQDQRHARSLAQLSLDSARTNAARDLEAARTRVADAKRQLREVEVKIEQCTVTAPIAGLAVIGTNTDNWPERRPYRLGDLVGSRSSPVMIYDVQQMQVRCQIGEMDIARVRTEQEVFVSSSAHSSRRYRGKVAVIEELAREANVWEGGTPGKRIFGVLVKLRDTDPNHMRPGMTVDLEIVLESLPEAMIVPIRAVFTEGERSLVYRARGATFEQVPVTSVLRNDLHIAVTGNVREGDRVALERVEASLPATQTPVLPDEQHAQTVVSTTVKQEDLLFSVSQTGVVAAQKSVPVIPQISGRIQWVCENGIRVTPGTVLMRLDTRQATENLVNLEARLQETERRLQQTEATGEERMKQGRLRLTRIKDDVTAFERQAAVTLQQAKDTIDFQAQELEQRRKEVEVKRRLAARGLLAATEVEREEVRLRSAEFSLQKERTNHQLKKSQLDAELAERHKSVNDATRDLSRTRMWTSRETRMVRNEVENLRLQIDRARVDMANMTITSPVSGLVMLTMQGGWQGSARPPTIGDSVYQGREIATIVGLNQLQVKIELDQSQITGITMGQAADISIEALPGTELHGKVTAIGQTARRPPVQGWSGVSSYATFPVTITLPATNDSQIRPGMRAGVKLVTRTIPGVTIVPNECLFPVKGQPTVFVERNGAYARVVVEVGESNGQHTVITRGVNAGERVALHDLGTPLAEAAAKEPRK